MFQTSQKKFMWFYRDRVFRKFYIKCTNKYCTQLWSLAKLSLLLPWRVSRECVNKAVWTRVGLRVPRVSGYTEDLRYTAPQKGSEKASANTRDWSGKQNFLHHLAYLWTRRLTAFKLLTLIPLSFRKTKYIFGPYLFF